MDNPEIGRVVVLGRLAHFTDLHANPLEAIPAGRTDTYHQDCAFEWEAMRRECERHDVQGVIMSGDFFNLKNSKVYTPENLLYYSALVQSFGIDWYIVPGNHDLPQSSMDNYGICALKALLEMTPNMHNVMDRVFTKTLHTAAGQVPVQISGLPYYELQPTFEQHLSELNARFEGADGYRIALLHIDAMPPGAKPLPGHWNMASYDDALNMLPNVDTVCLGHIHQSSDIYRRSNPYRPIGVQTVSKPWSFGRIAKDYYATAAVLEDLHRPSYALITFQVRVGDNGAPMGGIEVVIDYHEIPHVPFNRAFVPESLDRELSASEQMRSFREKLQEQHGGDAFAIVDAETQYRAKDISQEVRKLIDSYLPDDMAA